MSRSSSTTITLNGSTLLRDSVPRMVRIAWATWCIVRGRCAGSLAIMLATRRARRSERPFDVGSTGTGAPMWARHASAALSAGYGSWPARSS